MPLPQKTAGTRGKGRHNNMDYKTGTAQTEEKARTAFYIEKRLLRIADSYLAQANCKSRNEFANKALRHYIACLGKENDNEFLTPGLESVLTGLICGSEDRIAGILFKLAVEISMMLHVTASGAGISEKEIAQLRPLCKDEVAKLNGRITFERAYRHQKG